MAIKYGDVQIQVSTAEGRLLGTAWITLDEFDPQDVGARVEEILRRDSERPG